MDQLPVITTEIALVMAIVVFAVFLFITELLRVDVVALLIMTLLGLLLYVPGFDSLLSVHDLYSGLSSNAVVSIIAVMILGAGLEKTGVMERVAWMILRYGAKTEKPVVGIVSSAVALISAFMQNVGATALFLPVISRISLRTGLPMSRLVMPAGFCAILGGTITMVASSPLIMLNDLLDNANVTLPVGSKMQHFDLFDVAPVGLALVAGGLIYFLVFSSYLFPDSGSGTSKRGSGTARYMRRVHGIDAAVREVEVPVGSKLIGRDIASVQHEYEVRVVASSYANKVLVAPPMEAIIWAPAKLAIIAQPRALRNFLAEGKARLRPKLKEFRHLLARSIAGVADIVVPPDSEVVGQTVRELRFRMKYGLSLLSIYRAGEAITTKLQDIPFQAGDTLICYTRWEHLSALERDRNFVVVTADYPRAERNPFKVAIAVHALSAERPAVERQFYAVAVAMTPYIDETTVTSLPVPMG